MHFSIERTVHTTGLDKPVVDHWLERKIAQTAAGSTEKDRSDDRPLQRRARYRLSYIPLRLTQHVGHMVKDDTHSERGNPLPPHELLFPINRKVGFFLYMHHPTDRIVHTTAFVTAVVEHWLEREIAQWVHPMKDRSDDDHQRKLLPLSYISIPVFASW